MAANPQTIEAVPVDEVSPFHDVGTPVDCYDLRLGGRSIGQVARDATRLDGMRPPTYQWVLIERDADLVLAVETADQALERARHLVAARIDELPPPKTTSRRRSKRARMWAAAALAVAVGAVAALVLGSRRR